MLSVLNFDDNLDQSPSRLEGIRFELTDVAVLLRHHICELGKNSWMVFGLDHEDARTDLVADEKRISESVIINRSQQEIWEAITTPQTWKMWFV